MVITIAQLNCRKNKLALNQALEILEGKSWIMVLNEPKIDWINDLDPSFMVVYGTASRNLAVITNMHGWEINWIADNMDVIILKGRFGGDIVYLCGTYFNPSLNIPMVKIQMNEIHERMRKFRSSRLIIAGDMNSNSDIWSSNPECNKGKIIGESLIHLRMKSLIQQ